MTLKGKKILVVDDEVDLREILRDQLECLDATVLDAENGKIAFEKYLQEGFDAILSDMKMPESTGLDLLNNIRNKTKGKRPVFIFITGFSNLIPADLYTIGASAVFNKPCKLDDVSESLIRLLKNPHKSWNRSDKRYSANLKVKLAREGAILAAEAQLLNLSQSGLFIKAPGALPNASELIDFELQLPLNNVKILGQGIVRWSRDFGNTKELRGFGLEFTNIDSNCSDMFQGYIKSLESACP